MDKNLLLAILNDWNFWEKDQVTGIKRVTYLVRLKKIINSEQVIIITGARRAGKSFLMRQLAKDLIAQGVNKKDILIVNFEDPRFIKLDSGTLEDIDQFYVKHFNITGAPYIFLDEIQEVKDWEKWVKIRQEFKKAKIIISGSNAHLLSHELGTALTGRHLDLLVYPLSFKEFVNFQKETGVAETSDQKSFQQYLEFGGFPKVFFEDSKKELLLTYFQDVVNRDVVKRYRVRKTEGLKSLINFYFSNFSNLISFSSAAKFLGLTTDTVIKFSQYFSNAYLVFFLKKFSFKVKEQDRSPQKIYLNDPGLINAVGFKFSDNIGRLLENVVFLELLRRKSANMDKTNLFYYQDSQKREVDFVWQEGKTVKELIQVAADLHNLKTREREIKTLGKAMSQFGLKHGLILTQDSEEEIKVGQKIITVKPVYQWLVEDRIMNYGV
ncbi:ATPase [Candidatus Kuenenbacteria bacterium CG_4_9_14_3_um_filter_39_14]|uniref:ATPase n=5 Tax=Candidatus Kueneniibacteriota TaxID=1752740 RepID=A0A2M7IL51_9BACT|nr:MAG: ATPase [Candidatus Kuenenbacteria bacterium CG23_combo_of_CG06-09_8_20_14_all_39_39]PIP75871.1 MAG: ATPase [Candidatus Kuenenbacteria bacterium CG22_combo_CG10-13_8_21_14_all_39_9]PIW95531.1 MAG: ATPase [Candidatus Kuenenbacteria bacterium CG_4_8_14_3_um_filter_39_15]PJA92286.1 MAG: ATPase [Candidatus Kuenenbacteria bacterium CG_4_9_14_3_um_filter_39_14]